MHHEVMPNVCSIPFRSVRPRIVQVVQLPNAPPVLKKNELNVEGAVNSVSPVVFTLSDGDDDATDNNDYDDDDDHEYHEDHVVFSDDDDNDDNDDNADMNMDDLA